MRYPILRRFRIPKKNRSGYTSMNSIRLVHGGRPYFDDLLKMIEQAEAVIHLQVYIFDNDSTGKEVADALVDAAKRNVQVYLLVDGYASQHLPKELTRVFEQSGIHFRFFEPLFKSRHSYFGRRLHHKIIVVDNQYAMVGGINISDNYNDMPGRPGWLDFALHMEGEIVQELCRLCQKLWDGYMAGERISTCKDQTLNIQLKPNEFCQLRVRRNDWIMKKNQVSRSYIEMFRKASDEIILMSGYFIPGPIMRQQMKRAVKRGVRVRLILAGISDVSVAKNAERFMYNWLFRNKIELYEYKPCVLHGKVAVHDRKWATIGSYNLNIISAYASVELNIDINNEGFAGHLTDTMEKITQQDCVRVTKENFPRHSGLTGVLRRFRELVSYWFVRLLFYLFTINFKQRD
jgi:cardiolipin synthase A/B